MSFLWSWTAKTDERDPGFHMETPGELIAMITGALMADGMHSSRADLFARKAWASARDQADLRVKNWSTPPWDWSFQLSGGRSLSVVSNDLPEDPQRYCDGVTTFATKCPRHLNHLGNC